MSSAPELPPPDGHFAWIATEAGDVLLDPCEGEALVVKAQIGVAGASNLPAIHEAPDR